MASTSFYSRIISAPNKINIVTLIAAISDNCADGISLEQVETEFSLNADESNSFQQCVNLVCGDPSILSISQLQSIFRLAEEGVAYTTAATLMTRLDVTI